MGVHYVDIEKNLKRFRIITSGNNMREEPYESVDQVNPKDVAKRIDEFQGCIYRGFIEINRVPGNFHFSCHGNHDYLVDALYGANKRIDYSHVIKDLFFGEEETTETLQQQGRFTRGINMINPLKGISTI